MSHIMTKPVHGIWEQQWCRSACHLHSLIVLVICQLDSIIPVDAISKIARLYRRAGWFVSFLVANHQTLFLMTWRNRFRVPSSPSPSSPKALTSKLWDSGDWKWWLCRLRPVCKWVNLMDWPHFIGCLWIIEKVNEPHHEKTSLQGLRRG